MKPGLDEILLEVQDTVTRTVNYTFNSSVLIYHANNYR